MNDIRLLQIPKWGLSMEEGTVTAWLISEGDRFAEGDEICEIETSKTTNVYEAPFSGVLRRILNKPGDTLPVGAPIGVAADLAVNDEDVSAFVDNINGASSAVEVAAGTAPALETIAAPLEPQPPSAVVEECAERGDDSNVFATLHARKLAKQFGVNLLDVTGAGRRGRISKKDVIAALKAIDPEFSEPVRSMRAAAIVGGQRGLVQAAPRGALAVFDAQGERRSEPLSSMRRMIADRLQYAKQSAPHYRVIMDCNMDALLALRTSLNEKQSEEKISVTHILVKACAFALMQVPECNIQFDGEIVRRFDHADICVAVALDHGLITPKITVADEKGLIDIAREMRDLTERARAGRLKPDEYEGGTFSISNLGMFGVRQFDAIINPPQCAILAVGESVQRYLPVDGEPTLKTQMRLCLSADHRVIDGALAARFLAAIKIAIEQPLTMIL